MQVGALFSLAFPIVAKVRRQDVRVKSHARPEEACPNGSQPSNLRCQVEGGKETPLEMLMWQRLTSDTTPGPEPLTMSCKKFVNRQRTSNRCRTKLSSTLGSARRNYSSFGDVAICEKLGLARFAGLLLWSPPAMDSPRRISVPKAYII